MTFCSRRSYLTALCGSAVIGSPGCLSSKTASVSVLSAGSLAVVLEDHLGQQFREETGAAYHGEYYGSTAVMRMIEDGQKHPDVAISADRALLRDRLYTDYTDWDIEFASNSVGLAYAPDTPTGERLESGVAWYEVVSEAAEGELAISDPELDPLGYRAILAFRLAEHEHGLDGFADSVTASAYREPEEPRLLAGVSTGNRAAAVSYQNMALNHGLSFHEFPDVYNFSNPAYTDHYATVSYTTDDGYTATGAPVVYSATVLNDATEPETGREFIRQLTGSRGLLKQGGLTVDGFPLVHGDVPNGLVME